MFQVSGWSISAPLKQQTDPPPSFALPDVTGTKTTNKRKRKRRSKENGGSGPTPQADPEENNVNETKKRKTKNADNGELADSLAPAETEQARAKSSKDKGGLASKSPVKGVKDDRNVNPSREAESKNSSIHNIQREKKDRRKLAKPSDTRSGNTGSTTEAVDRDDAQWNSVEPEKAKSAPEGGFLTPMQKAMREKLTGARFRHLNERMYTSKSADNFRLFAQNPEMWKDYHDGFAQQVQSWPENPVDTFISETRRRLEVTGKLKSTTKPLPRMQGQCVIVDMGCGDAKFAKAFEHEQKKLRIRIRSFDLNSSVTGVEKADCANLPLADGSVNVVLICLALMGTNWVDFIDEAFRVLHWKGELWIAEIKSRFGRADKAGGKVVEHSVGKRKRPTDADKKRRDEVARDDEQTLSREVDGEGREADQTDVSAFVAVLENRGFQLDGPPEQSIDRGNKLFVKFRFIKAKAPVKGKYSKKEVQEKPKRRWLPEPDEPDDNLVLKPCLYKIR